MQIKTHTHTHNTRATLTQHSHNTHTAHTLHTHNTHTAHTHIHTTHTQHSHTHDILQTYTHTLTHTHKSTDRHTDTLTDRQTNQALYYQISSSDPYSVLLEHQSTSITNERAGQESDKAQLYRIAGHFLWHFIFENPQIILYHKF